MSPDSLLFIQSHHIAALIALVVFLCAVVLARVVQARVLVRNRVTRLGQSTIDDAPGLDWGQDAPGRNQAASMIGRLGAMIAPRSPEDTTALRRQLIQAGFHSNAAVGLFQGARILFGAGLSLVLPAAEALLETEISSGLLPLWMLVLGVVGLILPSVWLDHRRASMRRAYRIAFPDFMDLLVVCVESGQSLHGALDRVSQEIEQFSPGLAANLHIMSLELRAGRTLSDALDGLRVRLDIDEVKSLQILLKQSEELGTSISATLRVFSDEMRDKRISHAEAKAYALPVKMTVPLGLFIFPVILMVILVPIVIRVRSAFL